jgi:hypothetical protein
MAISTTTTLHLRSSAPSRLPRPLARQPATMLQRFSRVRRHQAADHTPASKPRPPSPTPHHASIDNDLRSHVDEEDTIETERASSPSRLARTYCKKRKKRRKRHPAAWFLPAGHHIMAPRSTSFAQYPQDDLENSPWEQLSAVPPWFRDIRPDDPEYLHKCTLPELHNQNHLPLANWHAAALPWSRWRSTQTSLKTTGARASIENKPRGMADSLVTKPPRRQ